MRPSGFYTCRRRLPLPIAQRPSSIPEATAQKRAWNVVLAPQRVALVACPAVWGRLPGRSTAGQASSATPFSRNALKQASDSAGLDVDVHAAIGRIGTSSRHERDVARHRTDEPGPAVDKEIANRQRPALRLALGRRGRGGA